MAGRPTGCSAAHKSLGFSRARSADDALAIWLNAAARGVPGGRVAAGTAARWLAGVEVALMLALAVVGRRRSAVRMLGAVGLVYPASELLGLAWRRDRPFARLSDAIEPLVDHAAGRSFPSRHVASAVAMATIAHHAHPRLGAAVALVAAGLAVSRVAVGLHYPSDVLAGALLGGAIGRWLRG